MQFHAMTDNLKALLILALDVLLLAVSFFSHKHQKKETASKFSSQLRSEKSRICLQRHARAAENVFCDVQDVRDSRSCKMQRFAFIKDGFFGRRKAPSDVFFQNLHFVFLTKRNEKIALDTLKFQK